MSTSQREHEWTGVGELPVDDGFAAALEREHSATDRTVHQAETLLGSVNELVERSQFRGDLEATVRDLAASASSLRIHAPSLVRRGPADKPIARPGEERGPGRATWSSGPCAIPNGAVGSEADRAQVPKVVASDFVAYSRADDV